MKFFILSISMLLSCSMVSAQTKQTSLNLNLHQFLLEPIPSASEEGDFCEGIFDKLEKKRKDAKAESIKLLSSEPLTQEHFGSVLALEKLDCLLTKHQSNPEESRWDNSLFQSDLYRQLPSQLNSIIENAISNGKSIGNIYPIIFNLYLSLSHFQDKKELAQPLTTTIEKLGQDAIDGKLDPRSTSVVFESMSAFSSDLKLTSGQELDSIARHIHLIEQAHSSSYCSLILIQLQPFRSLQSINELVEKQKANWFQAIGHLVKIAKACEKMSEKEQKKQTTNEESTDEEFVIDPNEAVVSATKNLLALILASKNEGLKSQGWAQVMDVVQDKKWRTGVLDLVVNSMLLSKTWTQPQVSEFLTKVLNEKEIIHEMVPPPFEEFEDPAAAVREAKKQWIQQMKPKLKKQKS